MASSGKSLSYSRASADDDDRSNESRSRSGDNRDQRQQARRIQSDPKEKEQYMDAANRERQSYDESLRQYRERGDPSMGSGGATAAKPGVYDPISRSPSTSHRGVCPETYRIDTPPSHSGRLRATPSASPRTSSTPASPFVMIEEERPRSGVPPRPTSRSKFATSDLLRQVESAAGDMSASQ